MRTLIGLVVIVAVALAGFPEASSQPIRTKRGLVISANSIASEIGGAALRDGGTAIDAAVATAFAMAVTFPFAGNIGGGGFLVYRSAAGDAVAYDFRETAPARSSPTMFLVNGRYDSNLHHNSHVAVGVPGTVSGLHVAWKDHGKLPWRRLVDPAIKLARDGFPVSEGLARSLAGVLDNMKPYPASVAQFSKKGAPYEAGEILKQPDLARTLQRIAAQGPDGFYKGETAELIEKEMKANGGLITREDLAGYQVKKRVPIRGTYRGYDVLSMPPISSGGLAIVEMLNILEGYDLKASGFGSARSIHLVAESMRRAYADRAQHLGDPDFNPGMPVDRLASKDHAAKLRATIDPDRASKSSPDSFSWPTEGNETTHLSIVDEQRNAVSMTYTLEAGYGSKITVPGGGFLLNNEMGDFNAGPGLTDRTGLIGTTANLATPGKRMLSSMSPTILARDGRLFMTVGSMGGRTIINSVLLAILNVVDFGMNVQEALDAPRFHQQWLPDELRHEKRGLSPDTMELLRARGHALQEVAAQGVSQAIVYDVKGDMLEGASDRRDRDGAAIGR